MCEGECRALCERASDRNKFVSWRQRQREREVEETFTNCKLRVHRARARGEQAPALIACAVEHNCTGNFSKIQFFDKKRNQNIF